MKRTILIYGVLSGVIIIGSMIFGVVAALGESSTQVLEWLGYLIMLVALSMIFVGIKGYRDKELGGVIRFGTGLLLGLGITAVASVIYVAAWEVNLAVTDYTFIEDYAQAIIAEKQAAGVTGAEMDAIVAQMQEMKINYAKPSYRLPMTFLEIFPVGLLISLISAAFLRKRD